MRVTRIIIYSITVHKPLFPLVVFFFLLFCRTGELRFFCIKNRPGDKIGGTSRIEVILLIKLISNHS